MPDHSAIGTRSAGFAACDSARTRSCAEREPPELSECSALAPNPPSGVLDPLVWLSSLRPEQGTDTLLWWTDSFEYRQQRREAALKLLQRSHGL